MLNQLKAICESPNESDSTGLGISYGMTYHDRNSATEYRNLLGWLGFGSTTRNTDAPAAEATDTAATTGINDDPRERRRRQLLTDVGSFLMTHRLEINPYTLAMAHDVLPAFQI